MAEAETTEPDLDPNTVRDLDREEGLDSVDEQTDPDFDYAEPGLYYDYATDEAQTRARVDAIVDAWHIQNPGARYPGEGFPRSLKKEITKQWRELSRRQDLSRIITRDHVKNRVHEFQRTVRTNPEWDRGATVEGQTRGQGAPGPQGQRGRSTAQQQPFWPTGALPAELADLRTALVEEFKDLPNLNRSERTQAIRALINGQPEVFRRDPRLARTAMVSRVREIRTSIMQGWSAVKDRFTAKDFEKAQSQAEAAEAQEFVEDTGLDFEDIDEPLEPVTKAQVEAMFMAMVAAEPKAALALLLQAQRLLHRGAMTDGTITPKEARFAANIIKRAFTAIRRDEPVRRLAADLFGNKQPEVAAAKVNEDESVRTPSLAPDNERLAAATRLPDSVRRVLNKFQADMGAPADQLRPAVLRAELTDSLKSLSDSGEINVEQYGIVQDLADQLAEDVREGRPTTYSLSELTAEPDTARAFLAGAKLGAAPDLDDIQDGLTAACKGQVNRADTGVSDPTPVTTNDSADSGLATESVASATAA